MKITKPFCIDDDLISGLNKVNASRLVNSLLREHFDTENSQNLTKLKQRLREKAQKKSILLAEIRLLKRNINEITQKEAKILAFSKKYPDYIFKIINGCDDVMKFYSIYRNDVKLKRFGWMELKRVFNHVKGGNK